MIGVEWNDAFFDLDTIAETVAYTSPAGATSSIPILFDSEFVSMQEVGEMGVGSSNPVAICKTADASTAGRGARVVRGTVTYNVIEARPDGQGVTTLILSRDS